MPSLLRSSAAVLVTCLLSLTAAVPTPQVSTQPQTISGKYVIQLKSSSNLASHLSWIKGIHARSVEQRGLDLNVVPGVERQFEFGEFKAYSGGFDAATIKLLKASSDVLIVQEDIVYRTEDNGVVEVAQSDLATRSEVEERDLEKRTLTKQTTGYNGQPEWGLKTISHRPPPNDTYYWYDDSAGKNTYAYVVDTGIRITHSEFGGRAIAGWTGWPSENNTDDTGHGTHVAGTIGGATYGVCKSANLIAVKVFKNNTSAGSIILDGYNWAVNDIKNKSRVGMSVINLSLGGGKDSVFNNAIAAAYNQNITSVVAAMNDNQDAGNVSPASAPQAITVGAMNSSYVRADFSNYGSVVDLHAPGVLIMSSWYTSDSAIVWASGTSQAAPHVSGLVLYFSALMGKMSSAAMNSTIINFTSKNAITKMIAGTPNLLAYNNSGK